MQGLAGGSSGEEGAARVAGGVRPLPRHEGANQQSAHADLGSDPITNCYLEIGDLRVREM